MDNQPKRVVVLISGRGSNLGALLAAMPGKHYQVSLVVSDKDAPGLELAREKEIPTKSFLRSEFASRELQREAIFSAVRDEQPHLVLLAGFMMIIPARFTDEFAGRLLNIHPSLLPKYPGLDTHQRALSDGETLHGCSVHFVDQGMDTGPLVAQGACPIEVGDSAETLAARVLTIEHRLYPWVVEQICLGQIIYSENGVFFSSDAEKEAHTMGFIPMIEKNPR